jgi:hypothetical protein
LKLFPTVEIPHGKKHFQKLRKERPLEKVYELQALVFLALLQDILQATKHARELLSFE